MPIRFIPNDPLANAGPPPRRQTAHPNRPAGRAGFTWAAHGPAAVYPVGSADFLFWQSREAALRAVTAYETLAGAPVTAWARSANRRTLALRPNAGVDLNAYYDGQSLSFFQYTAGGITTYSGASTDVVAHETGHALLDRLRPDLWSSSFTETGAFHESFGDCIALLTGFGDLPTRHLVRGRLREPNFLEATAEDLSAGVRRVLGASHPAAEPRRALNRFRWALPSTLPASGPPRVLAAEVHSFARVFTGCFWDLLLNILDAAGTPDTPSSAQLTRAVRVAGRLLIGGAAQAPLTARFFQSVGRTMVLVDQVTNGGANRAAIHAAFDRHGIALGSSAMLAPVAALPGRAPALGRAAQRAILPSVSLEALRQRIGALPGAPLRVRATQIGESRVARAVHRREVPLAGLDRRLRGVAALAPETLLIGAVDDGAAILGGLPDRAATVDETHAFVASLLAADRIAFKPEAVRGGIRSARSRDERKRLPTHAVREVGGRRVLERVRFACGGEVDRE